MFEAKLADGTVLKKIVEAIKELVTDVNLEVSSKGISLQAMDSSHVALVQLQLDVEGFEVYKTDKPMTLGISINNLSKVMKLVNNNDSITLRCDQKDEPTSISIICESKKLDRVTEFHLNLLSLDSESLGIPETSYASEISMQSAEFAKLCKELYALSETVTFEITPNQVKFVVDGEVGSGSIMIKTSEATEGAKNENEPTEMVCLSFALRYLNLFNKAYTLSNSVKI